MASEASTASGQPGPSHAGTCPIESTENTRPPGHPQRARGRPPINRDAIRNVDACITQLTIVVAQMVATLNQANGMPVPSVMQELGINIPQPHGRRKVPNQSQTLTQDRRLADTRNQQGSQSRNHESHGTRVSGHHSKKHSITRSGGEFWSHFPSRKPQSP